jgi:hypothetical protein
VLWDREGDAKLEELGRDWDQNDLETVKLSIRGLYGALNNGFIGSSLVPYLKSFLEAWIWEDELQAGR